MLVFVSLFRSDLCVCRSALHRNTTEADSPRKRRMAYWDILNHYFITEWLYHISSPQCIKFQHLKQKTPASSTRWSRSILCLLLCVTGSDAAQSDHQCCCTDKEDQGPQHIEQCCSDTAAARELNSCCVWYLHSVNFAVIIICYSLSIRGQCRFIIICHTIYRSSVIKCHWCRN